MRNTIRGTVRSTQGRCAWIATILGVLTVFASVLTAADADTTNFKTGADLKKQLATATGISWSGVPIREGLTRLGRTHEVAVMLDRRADSSHELELECKGLPLEQVLQLIALRSDLATCTIQNVVYIGSIETVAGLSTANGRFKQHLDRLPANAKRYWETSKSAEWAEGTIPGDLVKEWFSDSSIKVINEEVLPHDLWPQISLPAMPRYVQLSLILAGFGLTCEISSDGSQARFSPIPVPAVTTQRVPLSVTTKRDELLATLKKELPTAKFRLEGSQLVFDGKPSDFAQVQKAVKGLPLDNSATVGDTPAGEKRFTLTAQRQPAGAILKAIAKEQGLTFEFPPQLLGRLKELVNIDAKNVTLAELLDQTVGPLGMKASVQGKALKVVDNPGQ